MARIALVSVFFASLATVTLGAEFIVGGSYGWGIPPDTTYYQRWYIDSAAYENGGPRIGDVFVFKYKNVGEIFLANVSNAFVNKCSAVKNQSGVIASGSGGDAGSQFKLVVGEALPKTRRYYSISNPTADSCELGQHFSFIAQLDSPAPNVSAPPVAPMGKSSSGSKAAAAIGIAAGGLLLIGTALYFAAGVGRDHDSPPKATSLAMSQYMASTASASASVPAAKATPATKALAPVTAHKKTAAAAGAAGGAAVVFAV